MQAGALPQNSRPFDIVTFDVVKGDTASALVVGKERIFQKLSKITGTQNSIVVPSSEAVNL